MNNLYFIKCNSLSIELLLKYFNYVRKEGRMNKPFIYRRGSFNNSTTSFLGSSNLLKHPYELCEMPITPLKISANLRSVTHHVQLRSSYSSPTRAPRVARPLNPLSPIRSPEKYPATISDQHVVQPPPRSTDDWTLPRVRFRNHCLPRRSHLHLWLRFPPLRYVRSKSPFIIIIVFVFFEIWSSGQSFSEDQRGARGVHFQTWSTLELRDWTAFGACSLTRLRFSSSVV